MNKFMLIYNFISTRMNLSALTSWLAMLEEIPINMWVMGCAVGMMVFACIMQAVELIIDFGREEEDE